METKNKKLSEALRQMSTAFYEMAKAVEAEDDTPAVQEQEDYYISTADASERMQCCRQSVYNRFKNHLIKGKYVGSRLVLSASSVELFNKHFNKRLR